MMPIGLSSGKVVPQNRPERNPRSIHLLRGALGHPFGRRVGS